MSQARAIEDVWPIRTEDTRAHVAKSIAEAPLVDEKGRVMTVTIRRAKPVDEKVVSKRKLMHIWIGQLAEHVGCSEPEMRLDLRKQFLPPVERIDYVTGEVVMEPMSTNDLTDDSTPTISTFLTQIQRLAAEHFDIELRSKNEGRYQNGNRR